MSHPQRITVLYEASGILAREILSVLEDRDDSPLGQLVLVDARRDATRLKGARLEIAPASPERLQGARVALLGGQGGALTAGLTAQAKSNGPFLDPLSGALPAHRGTVFVPRAGALLIGRLARVLSARRVTATVLEPAGEGGPTALTELYEQTTALFSQRDLPMETFGARLAFNVLPGRVTLRGAAEVAGCPVGATALLVPAMAGTTVSLEAELAAPLEEEALIDLLEDAGIEVHDAVDPAGVVGESALRAVITGQEGARARLVVVADEARLLAEAFIALGAALHAEREASDATAR